MRKRRVRRFELAATALFVAVAAVAAITWSDLAAAPGISPQYVSYPSTDGVTISGALFVPNVREGKLPGVLVVHGITDHKEYLNRVSVELARRGFVVLAIDLRDHGMSDGACTFGLPSAEPQDVLNGVSFLRAREEVDGNHIGIVGHSFGGMVALTAVANAPNAVNATVTWAAPINLTSLARDNYQTVAFVADKRVLPANITAPYELEVRSPITYLGSLRPNSTLFLHSDDDPLVPVSQTYEASNATAGRGQQMTVVTGAGHAMATKDVLDRTIAFLEAKLKGRASEPLPPIYPDLARDSTWLSLSLTLLSWPLAWLSWEFFCTRSPRLVQQYTFPGDRSRAKAAVFIAADVAAFGLAAVAASALVVPGSASGPFVGILPAPSLFGGLLLAGLLLCALFLALSRAERSLRGRDDKRFEEGESLMRSIVVGLPPLLLIPFTVALQYFLFQGADSPRSAAFFLPLAALLLTMVGLEAFVRLRVQRRLRTLMGAILTKRPLLQAAVSVLVGAVLFFLAVNWLVVFLFKGYASAPGDAVLFTLAVGIVSSILYDRTKSIVPGAVFSAVYITWVLNAPFHF